jgi:ankyrin repeat protein/beta-lactamase regulating signal transducer with metallopeptidase domain
MEAFLTKAVPYLVSQSWQIAILTVAIAAATFALRNRSAHVRYLLWLIVLAKCLVPPVHSVPLGILPVETRARQPMVAPQAEILSEQVQNADINPVLADPSESGIIKADAAAPSRAGASNSDISTRTRVIRYFGIAWIIGASIYLAMNVLRALRANFWLWKKRRILPAELQTDIQRLFSASHLKRFPRIWLIDDMSQPFVWGILRGSIYLPVDFLKINNPINQRSVLGHEFSHILRFDAAVNLLQVLAQAIFWFHPFVWWANKKMRAEREKCCDEMAVAYLNTSPKIYSMGVLETLITQNKQTQPVPSLAVAGPVKTIEERIKTMMRPGKKFYKRPSLIAATIVLVLAMVTVPTALVLTARAKISSAQVITSVERHNSSRTRPEIAGPLQDGAVAFTDREHKYQSIPPSLTGAQYIKVANDDKYTQKYELDLSLSQPTILYLFLDNRLGNGLQYNSDGAQLDPDLNKAGMGWVTKLGFVDTGLDVVIKEVGAGLSKRWVSVYTKDVSAGKITLFEQYDISDAGLRSGHASRNMYGVAVTDARVPKAEIEAVFKEKEKRRGLLHKAVADRNIELVRRLLAEGADVNAKNQRDMTPLEWGLFRDSLTKEVAELLIENGADVNVQGDDGWTPLHSAIDAGPKEDIVEVLVRKGADVNLTTKEGETPLHYAVKMGDIDIVKLLLDKGAEFNVKDQDGWTALRRAVFSGRNDMVRLFLEKGADTSSFHMAAFVGDLDRVKSFIDRGTEVDTKDEIGWTALFWAACGGQQEVAEFLIAKNADINASDGKDRTLLHQAAQARTDAVKLVELLIAKGIDVNAKTDSRKNTPLHLASSAGNKQAAELLISKGAEIDSKDSNGHTPLHLTHDKALVELLVSKGADVNAENSIAFTRYTPLHHAAMRDADIAEFLIDHGAEVDAASGSFGRTPLHQAVITGKPRIVELLIDKGADPNLSDRMPGITPLAWAVRQSHPEIVGLLITKGADINAENSLGRTAFDTAEEKGDTRIVDILRKHGAQKGSPTLLGAVVSGDIDQVKLLVSQETDLNAKKAALQRACYAGNKDIVKLLIANGADVNGFEQPLLLTALFKNNMEMADLLMSRGADIHARTTVNGFTPLHYMGSWGRKDGAEYLLSKGADIEAKDKWGGSPLHAAIGYNKIEVVKVLLDKGADVDSKDNSGRTPLDRAEGKGNTQIVEMLLKHGAKE